MGVLKNKDPETLLYLTKFLINPNVGVKKKINMSIKYHKKNFIIKRLYKITYTK